MGKCLCLLLWLTWTTGSTAGAGFDHSHVAYAKVLQQFNQGGLVDYSALKASPRGLNAYLDQLGSVSKTEFQKWHKGQQIAFLLNLYNASVLKLVLVHYPVSTFNEIGNAQTRAEDMRVVRLFGKKTSLNQILNQILRRDYTEPRMHFALVPAALGSPALREEPYTPDKLDAQLSEQALRFMSDPAKNRLNLQGHVIHLSPIFKLYAADFEKLSGSLLNYIAQFFPPPIREEFKKSKYKIEYTEYDWTLNDANPPGRKKAAQALHLLRG